MMFFFFSNSIYINWWCILFSESLSWPWGHVHFHEGLLFWGRFSEWWTVHWLWLKVGLPHIIYILERNLWQVLVLMINHSVFFTLIFLDKSIVTLITISFFSSVGGGATLKNQTAKLRTLRRLSLDVFTTASGVPPGFFLYRRGKTNVARCWRKKTWMCLKKEYTTGNHFPKNGPKLSGILHIPPIGCHQPKVGETMRDTWPFQWKMMIDHELDRQLRGAQNVEINHDKPQKMIG